MLVLASYIVFLFLSTTAESWPMDPTIWIHLLLSFSQPLAAEIGSQLFSDEEMKFLFKKLERTFVWSKVCAVLFPFCLTGTIYYRQQTDDGHTPNRGPTLGNCACLPARYCLLACLPAHPLALPTHPPACSLLLACLLACLPACLPACPPARPAHLPACSLLLACCLVLLACGYFWCRIFNSFNNNLFHWQANLRKWAKTYVDSIKKS